MAIVLLNITLCHKACTDILTAYVCTYLGGTPLPTSEETLYLTLIPLVIAAG